MSSLSYPPPSSRRQIYLAFSSKQPDRNTSSSNWLSRFDPDNNSWSFASSIPGLLENQVLKDFAMTSIGESIYIIGGRLCREDGNLVLSDAAVHVRREVLRYDAASDRWSVCASLNLPRYNFACTVCNNKIYIAGGQYEVASARSTSSVEMYDPTVGKWSQLPDLKRRRYKSVGVTWQGKVYVVGGFVEGCDDVDNPIAYVVRCSAEVYDEQGGVWDLVRGMWQLDVPPNQIVHVEGRLFSSGDCLNAWKGHIEVYDGSLWNVVENSQLKSFVDFSGGGDICRRPMQRLYITVAPIGHYLYFLSGYKLLNGDILCGGAISMVHRFDTKAKEDAWTSFDPLTEEGEVELGSHCCVVEFMLDK
ncbi:hypothetical protein ABFS83_13G108900 [Erythranthe nasuta]